MGNSTGLVKGEIYRLRIDPYSAEVAEYLGSSSGSVSFRLANGKNIILCGVPFVAVDATEDDVEDYQHVSNDGCPYYPLFGGRPCKLKIGHTGHHKHEVDRNAD